MEIVILVHIFRQHFPGSPHDLTMTNIITYYPALQRLHYGFPYCFKQVTCTRIRYKDKKTPNMVLYIVLDYMKDTINLVKKIRFSGFCLVTLKVWDIV